MTNKRKMLLRLSQKGTWSGSGARNSPDADDAPPAKSCDLPTLAHRRNVVSPSSPRKGKRLVREAYGTTGKGRGRKRMPVGNGRCQATLILTPSDLY